MISLRSILLLVTLATSAGSVVAEGKQDHQCVDSWEHEERSRIDFSYVRSLTQLEQCVLFAGNKFSNAEKLSDWLAFNDFNLSPITVIPSREMKIIYHQGGDGVRLNAHIMRENIPLRLGLIDRFVVHNLALAVVMNSEGVPIRVQATFTRT